MARHVIAPLLTLAAAQNHHLYTVLARHILSVQGPDILSDIERVKAQTGDFKRFDLFRLSAKYNLPPGTLIKWLESTGILDSGFYDGLLGKIGYSGMREALMRCVGDPGLLPPDGLIIELIEHGLTLPDIERGFEFFWHIDRAQKPRFLGADYRGLQMVKPPFVRHLTGRGVFTYDPKQGYMVEKDWCSRFFMLYPVTHAVWRLGGLNARLKTV